MANHFSALKRARQTEKKTTANRANKSRLRTALCSLRDAITTATRKPPRRLSTYGIIVDKGVQKGVLHKNTATAISHA